MSAVMAQTGATFEESLGMLTAITEVTRSASKASRGLVSIGSRLNQVVDESSSTGQKLIEIYNQLNIELYDNEGQLRSSYDIFSDLADVWDTLDTNTQNYIASVQAGTNQFQNFAALMQNFSHATEATETALNSAGSAAAENDRYMESLNAKLSQLTSSFQTLSNTVLDSDLVKFFLDLANAALQFLNTLPPQVTQFGLLTGLLTGVIGMANEFIPAITGIFTAIAGVGTASTTAAGGVTLLGAALKAAFPAAAAISVGLVALFALLPKISDGIKELTGDYEYYQDKIEAANTQLEENETRLNQLLEIPAANRSTEINEEIEALEKENEELRENIALYQERQGASPEEQQVAKDFEDKYAQTGFRYLGDSLVYYAESAEEAADIIVAKYKELGTELDPDIIAKQLETTKSKMGNAFDGIQGILDDATDMFQTFDQRAVFDGGIIDMTDQETVALLEMRSQLVETRDDLVEYLSTVQDADPIYQEQLDAVEELLSQYDGLSRVVLDNNDTLYEAMTGMKMTGDQAKALAAVYPDLSSYIEDNNGVWQLNIEKLFEAASAGEQSARRRILAEKEATEAILKNVTAQIELYQTAINLFKARTGTIDTEALQTLLGYQEAAWQARTQIQLLQNEIDSWQVPDISINGDDDKTGSGISQVTDALQEQRDLLQEQLDLLDDRAYFAELNGATEEEIVNIYREAQDAIHNLKVWYQEQGLDDEDEYIREMGKLWVQYQEKIESVYDEAAKAAEEAAQAAEDAWREALEAQIEEMEAQRDVYEKFFSYMGNQIDKEIDNLQSQRDQVESYWDERIQKLQDENDQLERSIELEKARQQLALAEQQQMLVYKDGEFQYVQNVQAISDAEAELEALEREEALRQEVANLEQLRDQALASIDAQIANWERYKEEWTSVVEHYQEEQDRLLIEQELGIELEGENWKLRLDNLENYVQQYEALMDRIRRANEIGDRSGTISSSGTGKPGSATPDYSGIKRGGSGGVTWSDYSGPPSQTYDWVTRDQVNQSYLNPKKYFASGTLSAPGGLSLVGEDGPELRMLNQGDGIIPADATRNLMNWAKFSPANFGSSTSNTYQYNFDKLVLPGVTDYQSLIQELKRFKSFAFQH